MPEPLHRQLVIWLLPQRSDIARACSIFHSVGTEGKSTVPHCFVLLDFCLQRDPLPYRWETAKPDTNVVVCPDSVLGHEDYVHEVDAGLHFLVVSDDGGQEEVEKSKEDKEDPEEDENVGEDGVDVPPI